MAGRIYSVEQINRYIYSLISNEPFLSGVSIQGEVSNLKYHSSGHIYFDLKDSSGKIAAAMFKNKRAGLNFRMREGDLVVVKGDVGVYTRNGTYQIVASLIQAAGAGDLYARFEALKKELREMGMFDAQYKQSIPYFTQSLGIVTAPTGAAVRDIIRIATRRNPGINIVLYPATVQGDGAVASIVSGIAALDKMGLDVIIAGRGGGSIEDLWAFNEEEVARAIFSCSTPIISAVGHETDTTIADFVADVRAATPSEAAEIAVRRLDEVRDRLQEYSESYDTLMNRKLEHAWQRIDQIEDKLRLMHPKERLKANVSRLNDISTRLKYLMDLQYTRYDHRLKLYSARLEGASPVRKLASGFSYISDSEGRNVRSIEDVKKGDKVNAYVTDGRLELNVEDIINDRK